MQGSVEIEASIQEVQVGGAVIPKKAMEQMQQHMAHSPYMNPTYALSL